MTSTTCSSEWMSGTVACTKKYRRSNNFINGIYANIIEIYVDLHLIVRFCTSNI
jgi:hypothetical protein